MGRVGVLGGADRGTQTLEHGAGAFGIGVEIRGNLPDRSSILVAQGHALRGGDRLFEPGAGVIPLLAVGIHLGGSAMLMNMSFSKRRSLSTSTLMSGAWRAQLHVLREGMAGIGINIVQAAQPP